MSFEIAEGVAYTPERQRQVAACMRQANDDFVRHAIGKLQRDGTIDRDWPVHISVNVRRAEVSWSLVSKSGHRFTACCPERNELNA